MNHVQINTLVQHYVCKIYQDAARMLDVPVIQLSDDDAGRINDAAVELEEVLTHFVHKHARRPAATA